jgi:hypothetical protein
MINALQSAHPQHMMIGSAPRHSQSSVRLEIVQWGDAIFDNPSESFYFMLGVTCRAECVSNLIGRPPRQYRSDPFHVGARRNQPHLVDATR